MSMVRVVLAAALAASLSLLTAAPSSACEAQTTSIWFACC